MKLCAIFLLFGLARGASWSYVGDTGVDYWDTISTTCSLQRQSPIDIPMARDLKYDSTLTAFTMSGYDNMGRNNLRIKNNGHSAVLELQDMSTLPYVEGGGLPGRYVAIQAHFHWGKDDAEGSEHTFRNKQYPLELHIVHFKESYGNLTYAITQPDGLAVLGFFYVVSDEANTKIQPVIDALSAITHKGDTTDLTVNFSDLMADKTDEFYRYLGSLTTPMCQEAVVWTVFENKVKISASQLAQFRTLYETEASNNDHQMQLLWNYRPIQKLYGRTVSKNYVADVPSSYHWGYEAHEAADSWPNYYATCSGRQQSPIDIPTMTTPNCPTMDGHDGPVVIYDSDLKSLQYHNYNKQINGHILNNGHTIQVNIDNDDVMISGGGLGSQYRAAQFHFHWGSNNMEGSEHTRGGKAYPLELHIVHYNKNYGSLGGSLYRDDGLAVLGFFFEVTSGTNTGYSQIISKLMDVKYKGSNVPITGFTLEDLTMPHLYNGTAGDRIPFNRYMGGLTTPPCLQIVTWSVMMPTVKISAAQLEEFRKMMHVAENESHGDAAKDKIKKNYRPVQALHGRTVYTSYRPQYDNTDAATSASSSFVLIFTSVIAFLFVSLH